MNASIFPTKKGETETIQEQCRISFHWKMNEITGGISGFHFNEIIVSVICPKLKYAAIIRSPYQNKDIRKIQRTAAKMVP